MMQIPLGVRLARNSKPGPLPPKHPDLGPCRLWSGALVRGYGGITLQLGGGRQRLAKAHIVAFELEFGSVPDGEELSHLCEVRACIRLDHLKPTTHQQNMLYGDSAFARNAALEECGRGHPFTPGNTYRPPARPGSRHCRTCVRDAVARYRARRRETKVNGL
jgi:hypothetical protein